MQLVDYEGYIVGHGFVPASRKGYYSRWVRRFLALELPGELSESEMVSQYLEMLRADGKIEDWQLDQARHAVELYLNMYLPDARAREGVGRGDFDALHEEMKRLLRLKHYSLRTENTYLDWVRRYRDFCGMRILAWEESKAVREFLTDLAVRGKVAAGTQNQAFNALLFFFRHVLEKDLDDIKGAVRAKGKRNLPVVLSVEEVKAVLGVLEGTERLILELVYGAGLRVSEVIRLRVMDVDFGNGVLRIIDAKGGKDRAVPLPRCIEEALKEHLAKVQALHEDDLMLGFGEAYLPPALSRKYGLESRRELKWQYVFPSSNLSVDPRSGATRRHHILPHTVQRIVRKAAMMAGIDKKVTVHTLRHSFATHLLLNGVNIRDIQELLGHKNVETTMIYTHVVRDLSTTPRSPLDLIRRAN